MKDIFGRSICTGDYILYAVRAGTRADIKFGLVTDVADNELLLITAALVSRGKGTEWELQKNGLSVKLSKGWKNIMVLDAVPDLIKDLLND